MTSHAWDEIRRALGRMAGKTRTHSVDAGELYPQAAVRRAKDWDTMPVLAGQQETNWPLTVPTRLLPAPVAPPGGGNANLAVVSTVISGNETLSMRPECIRSAPLNSSCWAQLLPLPAQTHARVRTEPIVLPGKTLLRRAQLMPQPRLHALTRFVPQRAHVKNGLSLLANVPLSRPRSDTQACTQERKGLAQATNTPEADITLVGVYPNVPLSRAKRLSVSANGDALRLWLNPDLFQNGPPRLVTVVIGRQTSTGKALQTVLAPPKGKTKAKNP